MSETGRGSVTRIFRSLGALRQWRVSRLVLGLVFGPVDRVERETTLMVEEPEQRPVAMQPLDTRTNRGGKRV
jgi:hypothetical protein